MAKMKKEKGEEDITRQPVQAIKGMFLCEQPKTGEGKWVQVFWINSNQQWWQHKNIGLSNQISTTAIELHGKVLKKGGEQFNAHVKFYM